MCWKPRPAAIERDGGDRVGRLEVFSRLSARRRDAVASLGWDGKPPFGQPVSDGAALFRDGLLPPVGEAPRKGGVNKPLF